MARTESLTCRFDEPEKRAVDGRALCHIRVSLVKHGQSLVGQHFVVEGVDHPRLFLVDGVGARQIHPDVHLPALGVFTAEFVGCGKAADWRHHESPRTGTHVPTGGNLRADHIQFAAAIAHAEKRDIVAQHREIGIPHRGSGGFGDAVVSGQRLRAGLALEDAVSPPHRVIQPTDIGPFRVVKVRVGAAEGRKLVAQIAAHIEGGRVGDAHRGEFRRSEVRGQIVPELRHRPLAKSVLYRFPAEIVPRAEIIRPEAIDLPLAHAAQDSRSLLVDPHRAGRVLGDAHVADETICAVDIDRQQSFVAQGVVGHLVQVFIVAHPDVPEDVLGRAGIENPALARIAGVVAEIASGRAAVGISHGPASGAEHRMKSRVAAAKILRVKVVLRSGPAERASVGVEKVPRPISAKDRKEIIGDFVAQLDGKGGRIAEGLVVGDELEAGVVHLGRRIAVGNRLLHINAPRGIRTIRVEAGIGVERQSVGGRSVLNDERIVFPPPDDVIRRWRHARDRHRVQQLRARLVAVKPEDRLARAQSGDLEAGGRNALRGHLLGTSRRRAGNPSSRIPACRPRERGGESRVRRSKIEGHGVGRDACERCRHAGDHD